MTTPSEAERAKGRAIDFLRFLAGHREQYAAETMLERNKLRIPLKIAKEAHRILRHL